MDPANRPTILRVVAALGFLGAGVALSLRPLREFDLPWHLAYGRSIAGSGTIPRLDDFAYTHTRVRYLGALGDLILYGVHRTSGALGLQVLAGVIAGALSLVLVGTNRRHLSAGVLMATIALAGASPWLFARPATLTFLFVAGVMLLIETHRRAPDTRRGREALLGAALLHAPWVNVHGGAVLGVGLLGLYAAERGAASRFSSRWPGLLPERDAGHARFAAGATGLAWGACLLQPFGFSYFRGPLDVGSARSLLGEWAHTSSAFFVRAAPITGATLVVLALSIGLGRSQARRALPGFELCVTLLAAALSTRVRFVPVAIVLLAPIAARRLADSLPDRLPLRLGAGLLSSALGPGLLITHDAPPSVGFDPAYFPEHAVDYVERSEPRGHLWNFWPYGGYLIWRLYPRHRVLIDGRIGFVHDPDTVSQIVAGEHDARAFDALDARYVFQWAVCRATESERFCEPIARSPRFTMTYLDDTTAVYVRRGGDNTALEARGYRALRHLTPLSFVLSRAVEDRDAATDIAHDAKLAVEQAPESPRAWFLAACAAIATRDARALVAATDHLAARLPAGHPVLALVAQGARRAALQQ